MSRHALIRALLIGTLGLCVSAPLAGCGRAVLQATPDDPRFVEKDRNGDGFLSPEEAGMAAVAFQALDTNGDGRLSHLEFDGARLDGSNVLRQQELGEARRDQQKTRNSGATD